MNSKIVVLAAETQQELERNGCAVEDTFCQTLAQARKRAKFFLTKEYMNSAESTTLLCYAQVLVNGVCVDDFFGEAHPKVRDESLEDFLDVVRSNQ